LLINAFTVANSKAKIMILVDNSIDVAAFIAKYVANKN